MKSETLFEAEGSEGVAEVKEMEETASVSESNGGEDSERKQDTEHGESDDGNGQSTFCYDQLKAHSDNPVKGIDFKRREVGPILDAVTWVCFLDWYSGFIFVFDFSGISIRWGVPNYFWGDKRSIL